MKTTVVPAQITTVEDKVAGNLSFTQLILLTAPVFFNGVLFGIFPPLMKVTAIKLVIGAIITIFCLILAIRIKGKLLLEWFAVITRFNRRPRHYVFNKNDVYLRDTKVIKSDIEGYEQVIQPDPFYPYIPIATKPVAQFQKVISNPRANLALKYEKGVLRVYIREVQEEGI